MAAIDHSAAIEKAGLGGPARMLVGGELRGASDGATLAALDPATEQSLGTIPRASAEDVDQAVQHARRAFDDGPWRKMRPAKRAEAMLKLAALCEQHAGELARVEALDVGMPISLARKLSAGALIKNLQYYAGWADKLYGELIPTGDGTSLDYAVREPFGVIASIIPWNTPLLFAGSKLGPALATGNVVILKPSETASLSVLFVAKLALEAGLPPGVVQIITGGAETGARLAGHAGIDKVSFTGGGSIAKRILECTARTLVPTSLELGGKSANIVFDDADLDRAVFLSTVGVFGLAGQTCAAPTRLLVQRGIYDEVVRRMEQQARSMPLGDPLEPMTLLGPLVSREHHDRVAAAVRAGLDEGARLAVEVPVPEPLSERGYFMGPRIFTEVSPEMRIWREEIFGPVLCITPFDREDDAIRLANATDYGLAAGVWSSSAGRALRVAARLSAGTVWMNHYGMLPSAAPFGGMKRSGWGREGGRDALSEYTQVKNVFVDISG